MTIKNKNTHIKRLSPDGKNLAWIENTKPNTHNAMFPRMTLSASVNGKTHTCPAKACTGKYYLGFQGLWWYPNGTKGNEIIFHVRNGNRRTLSSFYGWTPGNNTVRTILRNDDMFTDCDINKNRLICGHETWTSPKKISAIDLNNGKISTILDANPEFQNFEFTRIEKIFGEDQYGHKVHAHLVYPKNYKKGQKYPLIITQYVSRGFLRGAVGDEQPIHVYAQNGMAVLSFDHHISEIRITNSDKNSMKRGIAEAQYSLIKGGLVSGIENMIDDLVGRGIIDPDWIGISGLSTGAAILDSAILRRNYAAASSAYSIDVSSPYLTSSQSAWGKYNNGIFGGTPNSKKGFEMRNLYTIAPNAHNIDTPYLLQVADREADARRAKYNFNALTDANKPIEMIIYPDEYHVKWQPAHRYMVYSRNLDWFNFWLRNVEDENPEKADQYERWHKLREKHQANIKHKIGSRTKKIPKQ